MGACGCIELNSVGKIVAKDGSAYLIGIYPSCHYCDSPAGIQIQNVRKADWHLWDVKSIPDLKMHEHSQMLFLPIISTQIVRKKMQEMLIGFEPENGKMDEIDAETLAEEAFRDLRDCVAETRKEDGYE